MDKVQLLSLNGQELEKFVTGELGESKFRAKQIAEWLVRGADIDGMTNLSAALRSGGFILKRPSSCRSINFPRYISAFAAVVSISFAVL